MIWVMNWLNSRGPMVVNEETSVRQTDTSCAFQDQSCSIFLSVTWMQDFASGTKLGTVADCLERWEALNVLDRLEHWAVSGSMKFNTGKFWVLHLGEILQDTDTDRRWVAVEQLRRDLGVLGTAAQHEPAVCLDSQMGKPLYWGHTEHNTASQLQAVIIKLYLLSERSYLEYCVQFWASQYKKGVKVLENVQRRQ